MDKLYPKAKEHLLKGDMNLLTDMVKATLVNTSLYTYDAAHETIADVPVLARVATIEITGKSVTNGVFDGSDVSFPAVTGSLSSAIVLWRDGTTDYLVAYLDSVTGLPVTPNGGDIDLAWDNGVSKIFALS